MLQKSCKYIKKVTPHCYQAKKNGLPQNNKNEHNAQNFRFGVFQNLKLMSMGHHIKKRKLYVMSQFGRI